MRVYPSLDAFLKDHPRGALSKLAKELGVTQPYLSMVRYRRRQPKLAMAIKIAARCHVPFESLVRADWEGR